MGIVKVIKGDIFADFEKGKFDIIGHGCNCMNLMGAGIADKISKGYPKAYETDAEVYRVAGGREHKPCQKLLGKLSVARLKQGRVANLYTQLKTGKDARYDALESALLSLNQYCKVNQLKKVGLPMIGAGIGGLDPKAVVVIMNHILKDVDVYLYVFEEAMFNALSTWGNHSEPQYFAGVAVVNEDGVTLFRHRKNKVHRSNPPVERMSLSNAQVTPPLKGSMQRAVTFGSEPDVYILAANEKDAEAIVDISNIKFLAAKN